MGYDCSCDYDAPEFYNKSEPRARKQHRCDECGGVISPGESYEYVSGKWDGWFSQFKTCGRCRDIRTWTQNNVPCLCWAHGDMIEDCRESIEEATYRAPEETKGLHFGFLRRIVDRNKLNRLRRRDTNETQGGKT